jgi:oligopeptide transport system substrate-binding protein
VVSAYQGSEQPTIHLIPEGVPGYNAALQDAAGRSGAAALSANKAKAIELWTAYLNEKCPGRPGACGYVYFMPISPHPGSGKIINAAVKMWNDTLPGAHVDATVVDGVRQVDWQARVSISDFSWYADYPDPQPLLDPLLHASSDTNLTGIHLPEVETLLDSAAANMNPAERLQQYQRAEQIAVSQAALIPISQRLLTWIASPALVGGWTYTSAEVVPLSAWQSAYLVK